MAGREFANFLETLDADVRVAIRKEVPGLSDVSINDLGGLLRFRLDPLEYTRSHLPVSWGSSANPF